MRQQYTYMECCAGVITYWAVITTREGHTYYSGPFKSRSSAYRHSVKMNRHWGSKP